MLDDLLEGVLESWAAGRTVSRRTQLVARLFFGALGTGLSVAGMYFTMGYKAGLHFRLAGTILFFFLGCFCFFNIALFKRWGWPGRYFLYSLGALFVVRILFGP